MLIFIIDDSEGKVRIHAGVGSLTPPSIPKRANAGIRPVPAHTNQTARIPNRLRVRKSLRAHLQVPPTPRSLYKHLYSPVQCEGEKATLLNSKPPSIQSSVGTECSGTSPANSKHVQKNHKFEVRRRAVASLPPTLMLRMSKTTNAHTTCGSKLNLRSIATERRNMIMLKKPNAQIHLVAADLQSEKTLISLDANRPTPTKKRHTRSGSPISATLSKRRRVLCGKSPEEVQPNGTATSRRKRTVAKVWRTFNLRASMPIRTPTKTKEAITEKTQAFRKQTVSLTNQTSPAMRPFPSWWRATEGLCILQSCCSSMSLLSDYVQLSIIYGWIRAAAKRCLAAGAEPVAVTGAFAVDT